MLPTERMDSLGRKFIPAASGTTFSGAQTAGPSLGVNAHSLRSQTKTYNQGQAGKSLANVG